MEESGFPKGRFPRVALSDWEVSPAAGALVDVLPEVAPAEIPEIIVPESEYTKRRHATPEQYEFQMDTRSQRPSPAARVRKLMNAPSTGMHQLYSADRDRSGQRRRRTPVTVIDLAEGGRILTYVVRPPNGEPMLHCAPGTRQALLRALGAG